MIPKAEKITIIMYKDKGSIEFEYKDEKHAEMHYKEMMANVSHPDMHFILEKNKMLWVILMSPIDVVAGFLIPISGIGEMTIRELLSGIVGQLKMKDVV